MTQPQRIFNLKKDIHDPRDYAYKLRYSAETLPSHADLRDTNFVPPIVDQGNLGSCTANAIVSGLREYLLLKNGEQNPGLSRLYLYWYERAMEGTINEDSGAYIRDGMKVLAGTGVCPEVDFPYIESTFTNAPSSQAESDAPKYAIDSYERVFDLDGLRHAIAVDQVPVVFGMAVYDSFYSFDVSFTGYVPNVPDKTTEKNHGGHCMLIVGYNDEQQRVTVRNSWGTNWGNQGYCTLPYGYFTDPDLVHDMWVGYDAGSAPVPVPVVNPIDSITVNDAIDLFVSEGIFDSGDFWKNLSAKYENDPASDFRYVGLAFRKLAAYMKTH